MSDNDVDLSNFNVDMSDVMSTCQHKDWARRHKDMTGQNYYLTSAGRNMPP